MLRPGIMALVLVAALAFSLAFSLDRESAVIDEAYGQVAVVVCGSSYGTGWFVSHNIVVTAYHVVQGCSSPSIVRGSWHSNASVVAFDQEMDVAALKVDTPPDWARGLPLAETITIGDEAYVVGYPIQLYEETRQDVVRMSEIPRVNKVTITWINPERRVMEFSPGTDAGNSGGPVVSLDHGGVAGIVVYARHGVVSEGFYALRADALAEFFNAHNIEYQVAGSNHTLLYAGLSMGIVALFLFLRKTGVTGR